jgi:hypothetical protein
MRHRQGSCSGMTLAEVGMESRSCSCRRRFRYSLSAVRCAMADIGTFKQGAEEMSGCLAVAERCSQARLRGA